ncbi:MAG: alpha/beta hydrolase [Clostridia bacterium]|nr:alpha/beta hydrolase [Clostridia bacterium]
MSKTKYPISREFFPLNRFTATVDPRFVRLAQKFMKRIPGFVYRDPDVEAVERKIPSYNGGEIRLVIMSPKSLKEKRPCFIYLHGGGFVYEGTSAQFRHCLAYAKNAGCTVIYVYYRLAPDYPFPYPQEDSFCALTWIYGNADELGIDRERIGIGGDSAGGNLSVAVCMLARDRGTGIRPMFQLLVYPWLDGRNTSESFRKYTDTPVWNSTLSRDVEQLVDPDPSSLPRIYKSPVEAESFEGLPPAYIEVAEFDPLHDDGICFAGLLRSAGYEVELHETKGTVHGFDYKVKAPTTVKMIGSRISFMKKMFGTDDQAEVQT